MHRRRAIALILLAPAAPGVAWAACPEHAAGRSPIERGGAHAHVFTNPAGRTFRIGCFAEAAGVVARGEATAAHTWFPGYRWRVVTCARCGAHLGWHFAREGDAFYGLIVAPAAPRA